jgi:hypothetical protein
MKVRTIALIRCNLRQTIASLIQATTSQIPDKAEANRARNPPTAATTRLCKTLNPSVSSTLTLYRPVGAKELALIAENGYRAFPPRLEFQPIFYPVLAETYAIEIARDWNTKDEASGFVGYVTRFVVDAGYAARFPIRTVGARRHQELWVPAEELEEFNQHLIGVIEVIAEFRGAKADVNEPAS